MAARLCRNFKPKTALEHHGLPVPFDPEVRVCNDANFGIGTLAADTHDRYACRSGVRTTKPSSSAVTLNWHDNRESGFTS